jgi:DNA (cytosine-5)-methyltransferase 1
MENVPNFMTKYEGKIFRQTIDRVRELGYHITGERVMVLNSANYGVPQKRKRMFLIGHKKGYRFDYPKITHDEKGENLFKDAKNFVDVRSAISDLPKITDNPNKIDKMEYSKFKGLNPFQILMRKKNRSTTVRNNVCRLTNERAIKVFSHMKQGSKYDDLPKRVKNILGYRDDIFKDRLKRLSYSEPSWTVVAHLGMDGYMFIHPDEPRTISVREAARLQSFPDDFVFIGNLSETYHMVGNAVPVLMAKQLGKELVKMVKKQSA